MRIFIWILSLWVACAAGTPTAAQTGIASGPLRISSVNSRYFTDGSGRAVYLAGSHNWHNFQDNGYRLPEGQDPPPLFDFTAYLELLQSHNHNFLRLWRWEAPKCKKLGSPIKGVVKRKNTSPPE